MKTQTEMGGKGREGGDGEGKGKEGEKGRGISKGRRGRGKDRGGVLQIALFFSFLCVLFFYFRCEDVSADFHTCY